MSTEFDALRIAARLAFVEHHTVLSSTNDRARELALDAATRLPGLVIADEQTAGRGRGTNRWWTGSGSLAFSLLLDPARLGIAPRVAPQLSLAAAVSVVELVAGRVAHLPVGLHWPNDVFVANRKLAGILVEALSDGRQIVGVGVNTNNTLADAPEELCDIATTLRDLTGQSVAAVDFLAAWCDRFWDQLATLAGDPEGLGPRYDELCLQKGDLLSVEHGTERVTGRCAGVAADGALLLDTMSGRRRLYGGRVVDKGGRAGLGN